LSHQALTLAICIGAQKAGTTWLADYADYMRGRPDVHVPPIKEVHYFDARFLPKWCARYEQEMLEDFKARVSALTLEDAAGHTNGMLAAQVLRFQMIASPAGYGRFMAWGAGGKRVLFEATPDYSMLDARAFAAMRAAASDVRLIFLLRNPADRFWSSLTFNATHNPSFDIEAAFDRLIDREDFRLLGDYARTIAAVETAFPSDRLHLEFYEALFSVEAVQRICAFLGVPYVSAVDVRANASAAPPAMPPDRRRSAVAAFRSVYEAMERRFGASLPASWRADLALVRGLESPRDSG
jgi:hypothetical protein